MKRLIIIPVIILIISNISLGQADSLSANQIWENYLISFGDREVALNIKTYETFSISTTSIGEVKSITRIKAPDKLNLEYEYPNGAKVSFILNEDKGVSKSPKGIKPLDETEVKTLKLSAQIFPEYNYEVISQNDYEVIDGKSYYSLNILAGSDTLTYLIYKETFRVFRIVDEASTTEVLETVIVDGLLLVKLIKNISKEEVIVTDHIEYKLNKKISNKYFRLK